MMEILQREEETFETEESEAFCSSETSKGEKGSSLIRNERVDIPMDDSREGCHLQHLVMLK